jgi:vacuolar-type H+-ATPase subunit H
LREPPERVADAARRAADAEQRAGDAPAAPAAADDDTETIRRTLILAQRTADAAIKEAEEAAQRTLAAAQEHANQIYREAQEHAQSVINAAENEARRSADDTRQRLVNEIVALEQTRDALRADHGVLEQHVELQRTKLRTTIDHLSRLLDDPGALQPTASPVISDATMPALSEEAVPRAADLSGSADQPSGGVIYSAPAPENAGFGDEGASAAEEEAWARFVGETDAEEPDGGPPTQPIRLDEAGDDAYLAELRKAMLDDGRADALDDEERRPRFGRRR